MDEAPWAAAGDKISVLKLNTDGRLTWRYEGRVLGATMESVVIEAFFDRDDLPFREVILKRGDRFVETFYSTKWYNVFEIFDRDSQLRKGWYCNVCRPARFDAGMVSYVDLALDLWVSADGTSALLDEVEFWALAIDSESRREAWKAVEELRLRFRAGSPP